MFDIGQKDYPGKVLCGIDEVGRGPLAGPVVAAAVIIDEKIDGIKDSKKLSSKKREKLFEEINEKAIAIGVGYVSEKIIDEINIRQATLLAMKLAVEDLLSKKGKPDLLLIDAETIDTDLPQVAIIKGDDKVYEIACASIVAKVIRDRYMIQLGKDFPEYDWENNKGYGTKKHREAILAYGPCPYHRRSFLRKILYGKK